MTIYRPYVWEIKFPIQVSITIDYTVVFEANTWYQVNVKWAGGSVFEKMREFLDAGGVFFLRDLDGDEITVTSENVIELHRMYKSLMYLRGMI